MGKDKEPFVIPVSLERVELLDQTLVEYQQMQTLHHELYRHLWAEKELAGSSLTAANYTAKDITDRLKRYVTLFKETSLSLRFRGQVEMIGVLEQMRYGEKMHLTEVLYYFSGFEKPQRFPESITDTTALADIHYALPRTLFGDNSDYYDYLAALKKGDRVRVKLDQPTK